MLGAPRGSSRGKHLVNVSNKSARPAKGVLSEGTPRDTRKRTVSSSDNFAIGAVSRVLRHAVTRIAGGWPNVRGRFMPGV